MKNMNYLFTLIKFIFYFIFSLDTPQLFKNNNYGYITLIGVVKKNQKLMH